MKWITDVFRRLDAEILRRRWRRLGSKAFSLGREGHYERAVQVAKKAIDVVEEAFGPDHFTVAMSLEILANLYKDMGQTAWAEPLHERAIAIYQREVALSEEKYGSSHFYFAKSLEMLANLYLDLGRYVQAEPLYKRALATVEKSLAPDDPLVVRISRHLDRLHEGKLRDFLSVRPSLPTQGSVEDASFTATYYRLSLDQQIILLKEFALRTCDARAWKMLGLSYFWTCDDVYLEDAIKCLRMSLPIGLDGPNGATYEVIGYCYACLGNEAMAIEWVGRSPRVDIESIMERYGSVKRLADIARHENGEGRHQGTSLGGYSTDQLRLGL